MMQHDILYGPFRQALTMESLPLEGPVSDDRLRVVEHAGILIRDGEIAGIGNFETMRKDISRTVGKVHLLEGDLVALPGFIDVHTHICYAGTRSADYAMRLAGKSYQEIALQEGGIRNTVRKTREAPDEVLLGLLINRANRMLGNGVTTAEVKSGYALTPDGEMRLLKVIRKADESVAVDLIPTCLAAHTLPHDFKGSTADYLQHMAEVLLPVVQSQKLSQRVDIFIDEGGFSAQESLSYLIRAKEMGFDITVHADQFTRGGSEIAAITGAVSADHLEMTGEREIERLVSGNVIPVCLPGASLGLGMHFAPARKLLDAGTSLVIASDWNPGSAPMGNLLILASLLGANQKLTIAETFSALTFRAAAALRLAATGRLQKGFKADIIAFPVTDYRDILYYQGMVSPSLIWKNGKFVKKTNP